MVSLQLPKSARKEKPRLFYGMYLKNNHPTMFIFKQRRSPKEREVYEYQSARHSVTPSAHEINE